MKKYENEERIEKTIGNELSDTELDKVAGGAGEGDAPEPKWKVGISVAFKYEIRAIGGVYFGKIIARRYRDGGWEYKIRRSDGGTETDYLPEKNMNKIWY